MTQCKSLDPIVDSNSEILILGSMASVISLKKQQYYANSRNRFWKVIGKIFETYNLPEKFYTDKIQILLTKKIAIWDILAFCNRSGSLDSNITNEHPNNLREFLKNYPNIKNVCFNGKTAYKNFKKYFPDLLCKYNYYELPSTSCANTKYSFEKLISEWSIVKTY